MDELNGIRIFVRVVEEGSLSATARQNHSSVSPIARQVKSLEDWLGTRLLNKTTRHQSLTEAGRVFFDRAKYILEEIERTRCDVSSFQNSVKGLLRVYLRPSSGTAIIVPALPRFLERYPNLSIDVTLGNDRIDLVANAIDVAVWIGEFADSKMIAQRLSASRRLVCGSPDYFRRHGTPKEPMELSKHNCLLYKASHYGNIWRFTQGQKKLEVPVAGNLQTSSSSVLMAAALAGLGLIMGQYWTVKRQLENGSLVSILRDYNVRPSENDTALYAICLRSRGLSPKAKAFVDYLMELFQESEKS